MSVKLGVVILNWNAIEDTRRSLRLVEGWGAAGGPPSPGVWVVDNASSEPGLEALQRDHPGATVLASAVNRGFAGGNNLGIGAALEDACDAVLLLNNDATVDGASVASMLDSVAGDPRVGVVGPVLWDGDTLISAGGRDISRHLDTHVRPRTHLQGLQDVEYVPGTVALIARRTFDAAGLLDEDFFFSGEMSDLCLRARRQGLRCLTDHRARAFHDLERSSVLRETLHAYYSLRNRFLYVRKHHAERRLRLFALWTLRGATGVVTSLGRGRWARARALTLGLSHGLRGRFGNGNAFFLR